MKGFIQTIAKYFVCFRILLLMPFVNGQSYGWCVDSPGTFEVVVGSKVLTKDCEWVSLKASRCNYKESQSNCPRTCEYCHCKNNLDSFIAGTPTGTREKDCEWVKDKPWRCNNSLFSGLVDNCPLYCGLCPDASPSVSPSIEFVCIDSKTYTFGNYTKKDKIFIRDCVWLTDSNDSTRVDKRLRTWCEKSVNGHTVQNKCPISCGICDKPSSVPSMTPTASSSSEPSALPSVKPTLMSSSLPSVKPSIYPSTLPSVVLSSYPSMIPNAMPSVVPSNKPSSMHSVLPTNMPSSSPSRTPNTLLSSYPSTYLSAIPSVLPSAQLSSDSSSDPSVMSSVEPSAVQPSIEPIPGPSSLPSAQPRSEPSAIPLLMPSAVPSFIPTIIPSAMPSVSPISITTTTSYILPNIKKSRKKWHRWWIIRCYSRCRTST